MKFNYQARNEKGQTSSGVVEASSKEAAIALLQRRGLYVTFLEEAQKPPIYARKVKIFETISKRDIVLFSRQLSIMFRSKVPLVESLQVLAAQTKNPDLKDKIFEMSEDVEGGASFSAVLSKHPKLFSPFYIAMVKAGEASGTLSESLNYLAKHLEREYNLTQKIKGAMIYPALIISFAILVLLLMIFFIIPNLTKILQETGQELPFITQIVIAVSDFFIKWWHMIFLPLILILFLIFRYSKTKKGKEFFDKFLLDLPGIGSLFKRVYLARFAENLSTLISGGLPISQSLEITADIVGNSVYKEIILKARDSVRRGQPLSNAISGVPEVFPPMFCQMVLVGEKTGTLSETLLNIVDFYQKEVDREIEGFLGILEPALIIFLGVIVGGLMFAVLMPLYQTMTF
ncbi:type II secretion system F family protein [bacterium]|nr:type II secretion system F family protein [bacterium]